MKRIFFLFCLVMINFPITLVWAAEKVVVIPLVEKAVGNATITDVLSGKTFSNAMELGLTGARPPAPVEKTSQKKSFNLPNGGDDGDYEVGEDWPAPRFSSDSYLIGRTDYATGLVWGATMVAPTRISKYTWSDAIKVCETYTNSGEELKIDDWRLPNIKELLSLIDYGQVSSPLLPSDHPFDFIHSGESDYYWTSTTVHSQPTQLAYVISFNNGQIFTSLKVPGDPTPAGEHYVLCVRGPFTSEAELR